MVRPRLALGPVGNLPLTREEVQMGNSTDEMKGRAKRAAGEITGDDDLKREGSVDKAAGKAKDMVDKAADKAKEKVGGDH